MKKSVMGYISKIEGKNNSYAAKGLYIPLYKFVNFWGSATQNRLIFQVCFIMPKIKLYVCRILCENFIQIGQKMKKLYLIQFEYFDVTACSQILARCYTLEGG